VADMPPSPSPFFVAIASFTWRPHRLYRVYVRGQELFFIYLGSTMEMSPATVLHFGAAGALVGGALASSAAKKRSQLLEQVEAMRERPLEELLSLHKHSFSAHCGDLEAASLELFGLWRRLTYRKEKQTGYFRFQHRERGKFTMEVPNTEEMAKAVEWLPPALGEVLQVRVTWDERNKRFVRSDA
jgi:hypothetical protein